MSVKVDIFLHEGALPTRDRWQQAIDRRGIKLTLNEFDTRTHTGYLPVIYEGRPTGFEYEFGSAKEWGDDLREIGDRARYVRLTLHGETDELDAAMQAAAVLTESFDGLFFNEESGNEWVSGDGVFELIRRDQPARAERGKTAAAKDAAITDRKCLHCGAPCPSYRKTCKACGAPQR